MFQSEVDSCVEAELVLPAYDYVLKCSHTFNLLDARGAISKDERNNFINRIRSMASKVAKLYVQQREKMGFPLLTRSNKGVKPTSSADTSGENGEIRHDGSFIYIKVDGRWKRSPLSEF